MHCPRSRDGKLPVYQAVKTIVMKDRAVPEFNSSSSWR